GLIDTTRPPGEPAASAPAGRSEGLGLTGAREQNPAHRGGGAGTSPAPTPLPEVSPWSHRPLRPLLLELGTTRRTPSPPPPAAGDGRPSLARVQRDADRHCVPGRLDHGPTGISRGDVPAHRQQGRARGPVDLPGPPLHPARRRGRGGVT